MSQFNYMNEINSILTMDGDISKGPVPRWQAKKGNTSTTMNGSINTSKISMSFNSTLNSASILAPNSNKTPSKNGCSIFKGKKTPGKSPSRKTPTPNKAQTKTPNGAGGGGDRFIPNRAASNLELNHFKMLQSNPNDEENNVSTQPDPNGKSDERQRLLSEAIQIGDVNTRRVFSFQDKAPLPPESHQNPLKVVYSIKTPMSAKTSSRYIPSSPDRILDAPDIINDYYLNLLDWSSSNVVAVALGKVIYLWNAGTLERSQVDIFIYIFINFYHFLQRVATSNRSVNTRTVIMRPVYPGYKMVTFWPSAATMAPSNYGTARKRSVCV